MEPLNLDDRIKEKVFDNSELVYKLEYDSLLNILIVELTTGSIYKYFGVSFIAFEEFVGAPSPGKHFNTFYKKSKYRFEKIK